MALVGRRVVFIVVRSVVLMALAGRSVVFMALPARIVVFSALVVAKGFARMVRLAVASFAAAAGLAVFACDFEVDLEAAELLIKDFFVIAIVISPKIRIRTAYADIHCIWCAKPKIFTSLFISC